MIEALRGPHVLIHIQKQIHIRVCIKSMSWWLRGRLEVEIRVISIIVVLSMDFDERFVDLDGLGINVASKGDSWVSS